MRADIEHIRFAELSRTTDRSRVDALIDLADDVVALLSFGVCSNARLEAGFPTRVHSRLVGSTPASKGGLRLRLAHQRLRVRESIEPILIGCRGLRRGQALLPALHRLAMQTLTDVIGRAAEPGVDPAQHWRAPLRQRLSTSLHADAVDEQHASIELGHRREVDEAFSLLRSERALQPENRPH